MEKNKFRSIQLVCVRNAITFVVVAPSLLIFIVYFIFFPTNLWERIMSQIWKNMMLKSCCMAAHCRIAISKHHAKLHKSKKKVEKTPTKNKTKQKRVQESFKVQTKNQRQIFKKT